MILFSTQFKTFLNHEGSRYQNSDPFVNLFYSSMLQEIQMNDNELISGCNELLSLPDSKLGALDFLLDYADYILKDRVISNSEYFDFVQLKRILKVKEGEFYTHRKNQIYQLLKIEFIRIYADDFVDEQEEMEKVNLQALFDLSYDQFQEFKQEEVIGSLRNGAAPEHLSISRLPKGFS